jgi:large subunit ribosomal protein L30
VPKKLRVRQVRSSIGRPKRQKRTLLALGLRRIGSSRELPDNDQVRGMVRSVSHLVHVEDIEEESNA